MAAPTWAEKRLGGVKEGEKGFFHQLAHHPPCACHALPRRFHQLRDRKLAQAAAACEKLINEATVQLAALARQEGATVERMQVRRREEGLGLYCMSWFRDATAMAILLSL